MCTGDLVCVQDTWYAYQDLDILHSLHSEYRGIGVSTTDYNDGLVQGHPPGGGANQHWIQLYCSNIYHYQCPENEVEY